MQYKSIKKTVDKKVPFQLDIAEFLCMSSRLAGLLGEHLQSQALAEAQGHLAEGLCSGADKLVKL